MNAFANRTVALEDVFGGDAGDLADRLSCLPNWPTVFDHLDRLLLRLLDRGHTPTPSVVWAWRRLEETSGALSITSLAEEIGASRKHLAQRFREEIGVSPKTLARLLRFRHALGLLRKNDLGVGEVARRCGYFDQAHLNRDFRAFAGASPRELTSAAPAIALP